jgi:hypothetical protein
MAEKDAKVRLNLAASGFLTQLQQLRKASEEFENAVEGIGDEGEKTSKKLSTIGQVGKAAFGGARQSLAELGSTLKSAALSVATLGGALSAAASAKSGMDLVKTYRDLAVQIRAGGDEAATWQTVQSSIEGTAQRWKRGNAEVAESYKALWQEVGDAKFAAAGIESAARAARAGYGPMNALTGVVGSLNESFGIDAAGIDEALASVISLTNKGGTNIEELGDKLGLLGATAREAGFNGKEGLEKILAMVNLADGVAKKPLKAVGKLFETLIDPDKLMKIGKDLKIGLIDKSTGKPFKHALEMIIAKSGGKQEVLAKLFSGDELKMTTEFGKTFSKAFEAATGDTQAKTKAGLDALAESFAGAAKSTLSASTVDAEAKKRLADQDAQIADAMRKLEIAFTKPEMVAGLTKLAEVAPKVAEALAKLLGMAGDSPKTAAAVAVGAVALKGALPGALAAGAPALGKAALGGLAKLGGGAAGTAGAGATAAGAAAAAGVVAAGVGGYVAGSYAADAIVGGRIATKNKSALGLSDATMDAKFAREHGSEQQKREAAAALRRQISEARKTDGGFGGALDSIYGFGGSSSNKKQRDKASKELDALEKSFGKGGIAGERVAASLNRAAEAAEKMSNSFNRFDGTNGMSPAPTNMSGSG